MLVRNLDYLSIPKEFSKVELDIYDNYSNRGETLWLNVIIVE